MFKTRSLGVLLALVLFAPPLRAQDEDTDKRPSAGPKVEGRNDTLKKAFKDVAAKASTFVVKVGNGAYGVILDGKVIVTTAAAAKSETVMVGGSAGKGEAKVLGRDETNAIALLECPFEASGISLADDPTVGQYVVCVGNDKDPVAAGVLSAKNRKVEPRDLSGAMGFMGLLSDGIDGPKRSYPKVLQHDAPMTDEVLGTALVDSSGKLVGVNVGTGYRGSSYALAAADLKACLDAIKSGKKAELKGDSKTVEKAAEPKKVWLGASVAEEEDGSLVVKELAEGGPAAKAKLAVGDRIYSVDGDKVMTLSDLAAKIGAKKPGDEISVSLMRDGEKKKLKVTLGEK
ncbi:MAG TPA: PDZ domain-containing protein [Planctomycetota bacterium]|nr:PDZ domain-containing protein [Planctomycetota bacterium]